MQADGHIYAPATITHLHMELFLCFRYFRAEFVISFTLKGFMTEFLPGRWNMCLYVCTWLLSH